jgi:hypothetical protein
MLLGLKPACVSDPSPPDHELCCTPLHELKVFENAYCQISVCSPSRLSFMTGRRPDHAGMYNFINHFR